MSAKQTMASLSRYSPTVTPHFPWDAANADIRMRISMSHASQGERYAHIASLIDGVVFDSTPIQNRAINGANAMVAVPGVPSVLWPLWWGALALWWHVLAGYCYPPEYRDVSKHTGK